MKSILFLGFILNFSYSMAQNTDIEVSCRAEAKQIAIKTYQSCVTSARNQKIDQIRKEYQTKLNDLKKYYDSELNKISGSKKSSAKGVSTKLPEKLTPTAEALPMETQSSNTNQESVIVVDPTQNSAE